MFSMVLCNWLILKRIAESLMYLIDVVHLQVSKDSLKIVELDRSHITFASLDLKRGFFDSITTTKTEIVPVDTEELFKILEAGRENDILEIVKEDNEDLLFIFDGEDRRVFRLKGLEEENRMEYKPPNLNPEGRETVELVTSVFKEGIQIIDRIAGKVQFGLDQDKFIMDGVGEFTDASSEYLHGEPKLKGIDPIKCLYPTHNIKYMLKGGITDTLLLEFGTDEPLQLTQKFKHGELNFLLAPRIEGL